MILKILRLTWLYIDQWIMHIKLRSRGVVVHSSAIIKESSYISKGVEIGAQTIIQNSHLDGRGKITIGSHCILVQATVITAQHNLDSQEYETVYAPVNIDDYVLMYQNSIILPGRKIGYGAVVAAGAVVTHDVPRMAIVAGNPAKVIRYRMNVHSECDVRAMGGAVFSKHFKLLSEKILRIGNWKK